MSPYLSVILSILGGYESLPQWKIPIQRPQREPWSNPEQYKHNKKTWMRKREEQEIAVGRQGSWAGEREVRGDRIRKKQNAFFRSCLCKSWGSLSMYFHALPCAPQSTSSKVSCIWTLVQSMYEWLSAQQQTQAPWASLYNFSPRSSLFRIHCHSFYLYYYIIQSECMNRKRPHCIVYSSFPRG